MVLFMRPASFSSSSMSTSFLLSFTLLLLVSCKTKAVVKLPNNISVPAVIVFGDSIMDTGNNNNMKTLAKCNFPPYGQDFEGGIPTGRFSNGKVPSDLIVEELGIKELLPAYLDPNLQPGDLTTGVCFASGASGYDSLTSQLGPAISLSAQIDLFKEYLGKLKAIVGEKRTNLIVANSIFLVVQGSNDISNTYFLSHFRELQYDVPAYTDLMVSSASNFLKEIYQLGGRRIAVMGAPPIGCVPFQRTLLGGVVRECAKKYNDAAKLFNSKLSKELGSLNQNLPNSRIAYMDIYNPLLDIIENYQKYEFENVGPIQAFILWECGLHVCHLSKMPKAFGLVTTNVGLLPLFLIFPTIVGYKVADRGCCGTGKVEAAILCNHLDPTCPNVSDYVFWDSFHPTERVYRRLAGPVLEKYLHQLY